ncbi:hypothetical protein NQ318_018828 [Aromia moschata]|uniref:Thioredoxin-like fold domain-containing protein n=1 Tax=Aromia moschata TaxID=1265417 RepID=A0AAV8ZJ00_9CUCU|nr:hypothetical protein NQ318_018828 [Aromia moschata]
MDMLEGKKVVTANCQSFHVNRVLKTAKIIAYYFTASWVNHPDLLEKLKAVYEEGKRRHSGMEVIYVSADTEEKLFTKHFKEHGPWYSIPFGNTLAEVLRWRYNITCMPQIVVVRKDGLIVTRRGTRELEELDIDVLVTWTDYIQ